MVKSKFNRWFEIIFLALLLILIIGIPLVFTPYTRSVFEVNKLLLLRVITIIVCFLWFFRFLLLKANNITEKKPKYSFTILSWQKIGLELPILFWLGFNLLSTVFSVNIKISLLGAYDRWEGIFTVVTYAILIYMYAKLITKPYQLFILIAGILFSGFISAFYGIIQNLGFDMMAWSMDPVNRVFACINNPVHFCPYMAMIVPIGLGFLLFLSSNPFKFSNKKSALIKILTLICLIFIYYAQILSYSRAAWIGFIGAMTIFYLLATEEFDFSNLKKFLFDFVFTLFSLSVFYLFAIFNYQEKGLIVGGFIYFIILAYLIYVYFAATKIKLSMTKNILLIATLLIGYFTFVHNLFSLFYGITPYIYLLLGIAFFVLVTYLTKDKEISLINRIILILLFVKLQFVALSWTTLFLYCILFLTYIAAKFQTNKTIAKENKLWLILFMFLFMLLLIIPTLPRQIGKLINPNAKITSVSNLEERISSYSFLAVTNKAVKGTSRLSMWKSALPWIKDYWLLGSGLDTVKYLYPKYRRPEYGMLEGGHNYTPDRLHNEYINTLATKGIINFMIYYFGVILGWYLIVLKGIFKFKKNAASYLLMGFISAVTIYLGQVMFNFGVVATLFLFYTVMGLALALNSLLKENSGEKKED
ncbi:MAG: O-antigen ligase family protein [Candidatus Margulisiibacteriota bacterium]